MHPGEDPFGSPTGDSFGAQPPVTYGAQAGGFSGYGAPPPPAPFGAPPPRRDLNTLAVLSPIFGVIIPPAGVALGHLALPQINRSGERGRGAAIAGLVIGYLMCVLLVLGGVWWGVKAGKSTTASPTSPAFPTATWVPPSVITSVAPQTTIDRPKLDLATVPLGTCVQIQLRTSSGNDALDLYQVDCEHKEGVYTVAARVGTNGQCHSVYVAAPPDHSFALCLNPY
jgi:Domain of unknown function (DUF4190)